MTEPKEQEWLNRALEDCFEAMPDEQGSNKELQAFKVLVANLVKNLEHKVDEARILWKKEPGSKQLEQKFTLLKRNLFFLRRFLIRKRGKNEP